MGHRDKDGHNSLNSNRYLFGMACHHHYKYFEILIPHLPSLVRQTTVYHLQFFEKIHRHAHTHKYPHFAADKVLLLHFFLIKIHRMMVCRVRRCVMNGITLSLIRKKKFINRALLPFATSDINYTKIYRIHA